MDKKSDPRGHMPYLAEIAERDVATLRAKESEYGSSWKQRGGIGAFMQLCRKWDRLEQALDPNKRVHKNGNNDLTIAPLGVRLGLPIASFDIITAGVLDTRSEGIIDDIRDLRAYLLLVEAEICHQQRDIIGVGETRAEEITRVAVGLAAQ